MPSDRQIPRDYLHLKDLEGITSESRDMDMSPLLDKHDMPDTPRVNAAARAALEAALSEIRDYADKQGDARVAGRMDWCANTVAMTLATFEDTGAEGRADDLGRVDFDVWCWRCDECAEYPEVSTAGEWRWTGTAYEHSHPEAQAHMPATCFGKWRDAEGRA